MAHKLGKKLLSWDESIDDEVRYRLERQAEELKEGVISEDERKTEKDIEEEIYADQDFWHFRWEDFTEYLKTILKRKNPDGYWKAQVRNFTALAGRRKAPGLYSEMPWPFGTLWY